MRSFTHCGRFHRTSHGISHETSSGWSCGLWRGMYYGLSYDSHRALCDGVAHRVSHGTFRGTSYKMFHGMSHGSSHRMFGFLWGVLTDDVPVGMSHRPYQAVQITPQAWLDRHPPTACGEGGKFGETARVCRSGNNCHTLGPDLSWYQVYFEQSHGRGCAFDAFYDRGAYFLFFVSE